MIHMQVARATAPIPAVNNTYELLQMLLLIGKPQFQTNPNIIVIAPTANKAASRSESARSVRAIQRPANVPSIIVPIAGIVLSSPSGSHVLLPLHR